MGIAERLRAEDMGYHFPMKIVYNEVKRPGGTVRNHPHPEQAKAVCRGVFFCEQFLFK